MVKFYEIRDIHWSFNVLRTDEGIPYYFSERDVMKVFNVFTNIKRLSMLKTLFYGCRSSELKTSRHPNRSHVPSRS